jgi:hypothetical protein
MSNEFRKENWADNQNKTALILIQGTGQVRAGIWARSVCIQDDFLIGSMLP